MDSFDRMFPNQNQLSKGGFGNLIALPLQKQAKRKGNSVFVNDSFQEYADQWQYLSSIKKISEKQILHIVKNFSDEESPVKAKEKVENVNLPKEVTIVLNQVIQIPKSLLPSKILNELQKLAIFGNLEFFKAQATGKYVGEGFDDSRLDTLFLTMPISWKGTLQQYVGRLHRDHRDKDEVRVFDYVDSNVDVLQKMFEKRLKGYKSIGYSLSGENKEKSQQIQLF
ncbi:TOTE conflict system archaeo-eukaryotic primase domain-containing protein [Aquibacillus rhizosphaerae]|uniref:TOTE conflict system primase domain-containing protein n=1 Tax=Aquibacillus rhizosphaerae TaxID=3051431 RepID=A0ABT7L7Y2_9BACI|nr:hypothetical protein [Aquibacillus sp. LR5S19]MDL4841968.1 hypothetical protein [Aquibacillus sp. LR5S19]